MWKRQGKIYKLTKDNLSCVPNTAGNYKLYDKNRQPIYVGTTAGKFGAKWGDKPHQRYRYGLRHRLGSYQQKDDYDEHPTKKALRRANPVYFSYKSIRTDSTRRKEEKINKQGHRFNVR